jgi:2-polyprenyl-6-methoxyphenol hydroxylase-like FAD-dependent oxidoreductase
MPPIATPDVSIVGAGPTGLTAACDGTHSAVRHGLNLSFEGLAYEETLVLADINIDFVQSPPPCPFSIYISSDGLLALLEMKERRYRVIAILPPNAVLTDPQAPLCCRSYGFCDHQLHVSRGHLLRN